MPNGRRSRKKIDIVHWTYGSFSALALSAGTVAGTVLAAQHLPETLLRTRGEILVFLDALGAPGRLVSVGVGFILVPEGTGTTVLWSPITDGDAPWFWVDYFIIGHEELVTDVVDIPEVSAARRVIDSKAMRKARNTEVQFVVENATVAAGAAINVAGQARFLAGS